MKLMDLMRERYEESDPLDDEGLADRDDGFLLVERSAHDRSLYFTAHDTKEDAAEYHDGQEFPEDWGIVELVDVADGTVYFAVPSTTFEEKPE